VEGGPIQQRVLESGEVAIIRDPDDRGPITPPFQPPMQEDALTTVLLIKAVEETDRAGTLIPPAERVAATREAIRGAGGNAVPDGGPARAHLTGGAGRLLLRRAELLRHQLAVRYPFVETVLALARGPAWAGWVLVGLALAFGVALSALDGSRRINILAFPLLGLLLWNLVVYALIAVHAARSVARRQSGRASLPNFLAQLGLQRIKRLIGRSAAYNAVLAEALGRFVAEWSTAARPQLTARAVRLFHLCAAALGLGLIAGLYLRGLALDYRAGWESTFLDAGQVRALLGVIYGPAGAVTGIAIPDANYVAALRWGGEDGGESAARWIHLLAATAVLFIVLPRTLLALGMTVSLWRRSGETPLPPGLAPYFRSAFGSVHGTGGRGIVAVMPYAYEPSAAALAALRGLVPEALGEGLAVDVHAGVRYGDEDSMLHNLGDRGGAIADIIVILFSLAATPEDENHGAVIEGVRDWIERARRPTQMLVLVDEGPYLARMERSAGVGRIGERRELWRAFVAARGLSACFADLGQPDAATGDSARRMRATLWQPAVNA
jgi:Protein of unknown function (DUF2868)